MAFLLMASIRMIHFAISLIDVGDSGCIMDRYGWKQSDWWFDGRWNDSCVGGMWLVLVRLNWNS